MIIFKLPDLGEGLPDAIIREWYIKEGETVKVDQPMVSMETAKALVDVPTPFAGKIEKLFGNPGDNIDTGQPLVGFEGEGKVQTTRDTGTVVGKIQEGETVLENMAEATTDLEKASSRIKATPAVRALAKKLGVDLTLISSQGSRITQEEVEQAAKEQQKTNNEKTGYETLSPVKRAMAVTMADSHRRVVPITVCDDANIGAWDNQQDITIRLIRSIIHGCQTVPLLNSTFDDEKMSFKLNSVINLGLAIDTPHGLYVPVIKNVASLTDTQLREKINGLKTLANTKSIAQEDLHGATITLSNFGSLAGRYGSPIVIPPMVAIIGVGRAREAVIPLSLTVDHRLITGGESTRFLKAMMENLS